MKIIVHIEICPGFLNLTCSYADSVKFFEAIISIIEVGNRWIASWQKPPGEKLG